MSRGADFNFKLSEPFSVSRMRMSDYSSFTVSLSEIEQQIDPLQTARSSLPRFHLQRAKLFRPPAKLRCKHFGHTDSWTNQSFTGWKYYYYRGQDPRQLPHYLSLCSQISFVFAGKDSTSSTISRIVSITFVISETNGFKSSTSPTMS